MERGQLRVTRTSFRISKFFSISDLYLLVLLGYKLKGRNFSICRKDPWISRHTWKSCLMKSTMVTKPCKSISCKSYIFSVILKCREIQFTTKISVTSDGSYPHLCTAEIFAVPAFLNSSAEHHVLTWIDKYPEMQVNEIHAISDKHYKVSFFVKQSPWKYTYFFEYELI